jgi:hypothetical protein
LLIFYVNGGKLGPEKHTDIFGHQSSIFPHSFQTFQLLIITYDEIFQFLAVEGEVLLLKPFLDLGFDVVVIKMEIAGLGGVFSVCQNRYSPRWVKSGLYGGWGGDQKWFREQDVSLHRHGLESLIVRCDKCLNKFGKYVENTGLMSKHIRMLFLSALTSIHVKKREPFFLTSPRTSAQTVGFIEDVDDVGRA